MSMSNGIQLKVWFLQRKVLDTDNKEMLLYWTGAAWSLDRSLAAVFIHECDARATSKPMDYPDIHLELGKAWVDADKVLVMDMPKKEAEAKDSKDDPVVLTPDEYATARILCDAIITLPGMWERVEGYMYGCTEYSNTPDENARAEFERFRSKVYAL